MSQNTKLVLYSYWRSSCSWRVRIALNLKAIEYDTKSVNLVKGEQKLAELPFALVPALAVNNDGTMIYDSLAIIEYLEEKFPDRRTLLPGSPERRAQIRGISLQIIANLQPLQNLRVIKRHGGGDASREKEWAAYWITEAFTKLEPMLAKSAGRYAIGDELSLVDVCIPPQVYNAKRFGVELTPFPTIRRLDETLSAISEFISADCFHQPDTPTELKIL